MEGMNLFQLNCSSRCLTPSNDDRQCSIPWRPELNGSTTATAIWLGCECRDELTFALSVCELRAASAMKKREDILIVIKIDLAREQPCLRAGEVPNTRVGDHSGNPTSGTRGRTVNRLPS